MKKIVIIECCDDCPHFDNEYYDWDTMCEMLLKTNNEYQNTILKDCPLEDAQEKNHE